MARKRPGPPDEPHPTGVADAAGSLAAYAAGFLAQPESRSHEVGLTLGRAERALLIGLPGLDGTLKGRLAIPSTAPRSDRFSIDELARICLAISEALLDVEGRDAVRLLKLAGKITDLLNQAIDKRERSGKARWAAPKAGKARAAGRVYQLKITLKDIRPPIWRRVLVPDCSLETLHEVIQAAMGWENYHLYDFEVGGTRYTDPRGRDELDMEDASRARLSQVARGEKAKLRYTYDFGDNWQHEVLVEKVLPPEEAATYPVCIGGKRACPPEDVGGPWGYREFAEAIKDPEHERHEEFLGWRGGFDPEAFDPDAVDRALRRLR
jgi:hypothetical protein